MACSNLNTNEVIIKICNVCVSVVFVSTSFYAHAPIDWGHLIFSLSLYTKNFYMWLDLSLVPNSRSSVKFKVKYQGHMAIKWAVVFYKHSL